MFRLQVFHRTAGHREVESLADLPALNRDPDVTLWLDLECPTDEEGRVLAEVFDFHPLAIEDALQDYGHPKLESQDRSLFCILHGVDFARLDLASSLEVHTAELDMFLTERALVTHRSGPHRSVEAVLAECARGRRAWTPERLFHQVVDKLVDNYLPVVEAIGEAIGRLEDSVIHDPHPQLLEKILTAKKSILRLRRMTHHQRAILETLARGHLPVIPAEHVLLYRDVLDHFIQVDDLLEMYRESVQGAMEAYLSVTSNRLGEVMRVLTILSTIMLPLTFIAGVYGMNFKFMPELKQPWGYPFALSLMALTAAGLIWFFRRRKWL